MKLATKHSGFCFVSNRLETLRQGSSEVFAKELGGVLADEMDAVTEKDEPFLAVLVVWWVVVMVVYGVLVLVYVMKCYFF